MVNVNLTQRDIDYIARMVDTEVPRSLARKNPEQYRAMVGAVVDTVVNRMASPQFPGTATGVLNQNRQFSKITGPSKLDPYGSVQAAPKAPPEVANMVAGHIADRALGTPSSIGGATNYANPNFSSPSNLTSWVNPMIEAGAQAFGVGRNIHYHGTPVGQFPAPPTTVTAEGIPSALPADAPQERPGLLSATPTASVGAAPMAAATGLLSASPQFDNARFGEPTATAQGFDMGRFGDPSPMNADAMASAISGSPSLSIGDFSPISTAQAAELPSMSNMADQYAQYGMGREALLNNPDYRKALEIENLKTDVGPLNRPAPPTYTDPMVTTQPAATQPTVEQPTQPQAAVEAPAQPAVSAPPQGGLLGATTGTFAPPDMAYGATMERQMGRRNTIGGLTGGILGGLALGPVGALLGGLLGRTVANRTFYPDAPKAVAGGKSKERDPRQSDAYRDSGQFRDAVDKGAVGLW